MIETSTCCRGAGGKCPVAISDLVLLHNKATESQAKNDSLSVDVFDKIPEAKKEFIKYCKAFEPRLRTNVKSHRVIALDEEQSTDIMIPGFLVDKQARGKSRLGSLKINLQFLEHHKMQYLELHRDLNKINYSPQTDAALQNFKILLELEISLLMGCDLEWGVASDFAEPEPAAAAGTVLCAAGATDDNDDSANEGGGEGGTATAAAGPAHGKAASAASVASVAASAAPAGGGVGAAASAAPAGDAGVEGTLVAPDPDFTTWTHDTWGQLDFSQIQFSTDSCISICSVRSYHAVAILFSHISSLRTAHSRVWDDLQFAWHATFHTKLSDTVLETWPTTGPHAFSASQAEWLTETLRYLKALKPGPALRRRAVPASPAPAPAPARAATRTSNKAKAGGGQGKKRRDPDPVQNTSR